MHRVDALADRPEGATPPGGPTPFTRLVPLEEIIAEALEVGTGTQTVDRNYQQLIYRCGNEFNVLLHASEEELRKTTSPAVVDGILRVRAGKVILEPGYDGEFGKVRFSGDAQPAMAAAGEEQMTLF